MNKQSLNVPLNKIVFKKVCTFLGIISPISTLKYLVLRKLYAVIILAVLFVGNVYSLCLRNETYKKYFFVTHDTLDYIDTITIVLCVSTTIATLMIFKQKEWVRLELKVQKINKDIDTGAISKYRNYCSIAFICYFVVLTSYTWIIWTYRIGLLKSIKTYLMHFIALFYNYILSEFIINLTLLLRDNYIQANNCIKDITELNIYTKVKQIKSLSRTLLDIVDSFNKLFGWTYLFLVGNIVIKLLKNFDFIVSKRKFTDLQFENELRIISLMEGPFVLVNSILALN